MVFEKGRVLRNCRALVGLFDVSLNGDRASLRALVRRSKSILRVSV